MLLKFFCLISSMTISCHLPFPPGDCLSVASCTSSTSPIDTNYLLLIWAENWKKKTSNPGCPHFLCQRLRTKARGWPCLYCKGNVCASCQLFSEVSETCLLTCIILDCAGFNGYLEKGSFLHPNLIQPWCLGLNYLAYFCLEPRFGLANSEVACTVFSFSKP